ncbi:MAG: flagellar basal body P-ring formation chaperone FlgA [Phycisphaerales bacterium]|nr:flagellar basal body P-ring formation protein FlgA [Planctomycetota bacterium]MCH8509028.1 flagellar basal body P-ring formation chaperone FlgA [Phycisphaerales bacterium]
MTQVMVVLMAMLTASVGMASDGRGGITTVSLRATVRLAPDQALTLGAIADIQGGQQAALSAITIPLDGVEPGRWTSIDAARVRQRIEVSGARTGSVIVHGTRVNLTRNADRPAPTHAHRTEREPEPDVTTVRDHLEHWLRTRFGSAAKEVRIGFEERDRGTLNTPTEGRKVEVRQIGTSTRAAVRVTVYEGDQIVLSEAVRVQIELLSHAPVLVRPLRRGERIEADAFEVQPVWTGATDPPADPEQVIGQVVRRAMDMGEVVRFGNLESPAIITRGQDVSVRSVRGSVVVTTIARARHDAGMGEVVELEAKDRSARFTARVAGHGRAVMIDPTEVTQ